MRRAESSEEIARSNFKMGRNGADKNVGGGNRLASTNTAQ